VLFGEADQGRPHFSEANPVLAQGTRPIPSNKGVDQADIEQLRGHDHASQVFQDGLALASVGRENVGVVT
jgi:hypothetical protein